MSYRLEKISNLIKHEVSLIFLHKLQDPALGIITVTNVKVSPDLKIAKIYLSILEREKRDTAMEKVTSLTGMIRSELASRIRMKFIPELKFFLDDTIDYVEKIEGLLKKIHENDN
ncbi:MAG TPA: 30S ribosome-binding factor RbfA [Ignavibacteriaceae bacterium]|mgnify:CR=1 FL=1|nr:30S ribosome-binding factor RbfA [Ignavibacteriaceae bacterium]